MSVIEKIMAGDWAGLQEFCYKMAAGKLLDIIAEKKTGVIARLNGVVAEGFRDPASQERADFDAEQDAVNDMVADWMGDNPEADIDWEEAVADVLANVPDYTDDLAVYDYLSVKHLGESVVTEAKKEDPKAKVRNKADCIFDNTSKLVKDNKDHFPIDTETKGRNALAQVNKYKTVPKWFNGSLETLVKKVVAAVRRKYPKIKITKAAAKPGKN